MPADSTAGIARAASTLARKPAFWMALQLIVLWHVSGATGGLRPQHVPDTPSFVQAAALDHAPSKLAHIRTYGYPFFLNRFTDENGEPQLWAVSKGQQVVFLGCVFFFWWALARFSRAPWLAFFAASALLYSPITTLSRNIQPDFLAGALNIALIAALMLLTVRRSVLWWTLLTVALFASYQLRPAGVFLIGLVPALGWLFELLRNRASMRRSFVLAAGLTVACALPFLTFATIRWATVGHFGLVSFGGINAGGMAACFLEGRMIENLPQEHQSLAKGMAKARKKAGYRPMRLDDPAEPFFEQYSTNIFRVSIPAAEAQLAREARWARRDPSRAAPGPYPTVEINERVGALAKEIVRRRPAQYRRWVVAALNYGIEQLDDWPSLTLPVLFLVPSLALAVLLALSGRRSDPESGDVRARALVCLTVTALSFFAAYMLLVSLVSFPFGRYFTSIVLFLPVMLAALLFETWRLVFGAILEPAE